MQHTSQLTGAAFIYNNISFVKVSCKRRRHAVSLIGFMRVYVDDAVVSPRVFAPRVVGVSSLLCLPIRVGSQETPEYRR